MAVKKLSEISKRMKITGKLALLKMLSFVVYGFFEKFLKIRQHLFRIVAKNLFSYILSKNL